MKRFLFFAVMAAALWGSVYASSTQSNKEITGQWAFNVDTAPYGYQTGMLVISEEKDSLNGHVKFEDGYKVDLKDISYTEGVLNCGLYIDYSYIKVKAEIHEQLLRGTVNTPQGKMKFSAKKKN
jgi:opacity protein-like surface antigen